jgi:predicted Zn-dependent protease
MAFTVQERRLTKSLYSGKSLMTSIRWSRMLVSLTLGGCVTGKATYTPEGRRIVDHPNVLDAEADALSKGLHHYLKGQLEFSEGASQNAFKNLSKADSLVPEAERSFELKRSLIALSMWHGSMSSAISECRDALRLDSSSEYLSFLLGSLLLYDGRTLEAKNILSPLCLSSQNRSEACVLLAHAVKKDEGVEKGVLVLDGALKGSPRDPLLMLYRGEFLYEQGKMRESIDSFVRSYSMDSSNQIVGVRALRIALHSEDNDLLTHTCKSLTPLVTDNPAFQHLLSLIAEEPAQARSAMETFFKSRGEMTSSEMGRVLINPYYQIALSFLKKSLLEHAERQLDIALVESPDLNEARYRRAALLIRRERRDDGIQDLLRIVDSHPFYVPSRVVIQSYYGKNGKIAEQERVLTEGLQKRPGDETLSSFLIGVLLGQGRSEEGKEVALKGLSLHPESERLRVHYAMSLYDQDEVEEAEKEMQRVLSLYPESVEALNFIAYQYAERGEKLSEAQSLVNRALEKTSENAEILDTAGWISFGRGNLEEAREYLERAVELSNSDPVIVEHLAEVMEAFKEHERARCLFLLALERFKEKKNAKNEKSITRIEQRMTSIPASSKKEC